ncbi:phosphotransferase-like protein [Mycobacterium sp. ML4]
MTSAAPGKLIVLNGGSSAGKTSLAQGFQDVADECWMHLGIDVFWLALPPRQLDLARVHPEYYTWDSALEDDGLEYFTVHPGPMLDQAMRARHQAIRAYLDHGMNVIADDVIWTRDWLVDALRVFRGYQVWMVGVHVSDAEGARREQERGDRYPGWNRGSARAAHADAEYDVELDTTATPVAVLARRLFGFYRACPEPQAFTRMRTRLLA